MSQSIIVFDPANITLPTEKNDIFKIINQQIELYDGITNQKPSYSIKSIIEQLELNFPNISEANSPWATWQPAYLANGHYCDIEIKYGNPFLTDVCMNIIELCEQLSLIMIYAGSDNPIMVFPESKKEKPKTNGQISWLMGYSSVILNMSKDLIL